MEDRYLRNFPTLTEAQWGRLRKSRVLIAGCGGLGGYLLDHLLRIGVGTIRVCDGDVFDETNLNRQLLSDIRNMGTSKAQAAREYARRVNPDVVMEVWDTPMTQDNADALVSRCDVVLDGLDNMKSRRILSAACVRAGKPYIFGAVSGWLAQAAVSMPENPVVDRLCPETEASQEQSVLSVAPALCAAVQAALCIRLLSGCPVEPGKLYYFDLLNQEFDRIFLA